MTRTAHYIAAQLHGGQPNALYSLASTGHIAPEIDAELADGYGQQPDQVRWWIRWLGGYCALRPDRGSVPGWAEQTAAQDRADMEAIRAAARQQDPDWPDALFGEQSPEEIGSVHELGWFGLVRHEGRPGGLVLQQDEQGFRHVWETDSDEELQQRWSAVNEGYEHFYRDVESQTAPHNPEREVAPTTTSRLAGLEERLAPLPDLGDIPRPSPSFSADSGYDWIEQLPRGWHVEPSWGRDGWDLGAWPLVVVALLVDEEHDRYAVATYTEGDVTVDRYQSRGALNAAVNEIAEFHWRLGQSLGPDDLPEGSGLLAKHCGPYSQERYERESVAERRREIESGQQEDTDKTAP